MGRGDDVRFRIDDDGISRRHCWVGPGAQGHQVRDLDSRNGTFVNGVPIDQSELQFGDKIAIGSGTVLLFTRRDPMEERLLQAQKLQVLGELASGIAHDFNNLLSALLSSVGFLRTMDLPEDEQVQTCMDDIDLAARRAMDLAGQLTAFAQTGRRQHGAVNISRLVKDATRLITRIVPSAVEIEVETEPRVGVRGDSAQLLQVLMNLCVNASDAMPEGGKLTVTTSFDSPDDDTLTQFPHLAQGSYVTLCVSDNGMGMDEDTRRRVFEPFFTTKGRGQGTGLGLSTAYRVVQEHGGEIVLFSAPGEGAEFRVFLPAADVAAEASGTVNAVSADVGQIDGVVLLVEDEPLIRSAVSRMLERVGVTVLTAEDGVLALDTLRANIESIDLVILDLDIPKIGGEEVLAEARKMVPSIKVLVSSGYVDADRQHALSAAGANGFLHKPYDSEELRATVGQMLESD